MKQITAIIMKTLMAKLFTKFQENSSRYGLSRAHRISAIIKSHRLGAYLENSPRHGLRGAHEVAGSGAIAFTGAIDLGEGTNAGRRTDVQMTRH